MPLTPEQRATLKQDLWEKITESRSADQDLMGFAPPHGAKKRWLEASQDLTAAIDALFDRLEAQEAPSVPAQTGSEVTGYQSPDTPADAVARKYGASAGPDFGDRPLDRLIAAAPFPIFDMTKHVDLAYGNSTGPLVGCGDGKTRVAPAFNRPSEALNYIAKSVGAALRVATSEDMPAPVASPPGSAGSGKQDITAAFVKWAETFYRNQAEYTPHEYDHGLNAWKAAIEWVALSQPVQAVPDAIRSAGSKMSNVMFNLSQANDSPDAKQFGELYREWDRAIRSVRVLPVEPPQ